LKAIARKKALVTGAASGIGRAIARALAREQVELWLLDVDPAGLDELVASLRQGGARVTAVLCDLRNLGELDARLEELLVLHGGVDIVVNNAGTAYVGPTALMSDVQWDTVLAVNLLAPSQIIRRLLPSLIARGESHIVNIASIAGLVAMNRAAAYSLTKFGLVGLSESLRLELDKHGVGVTAVCPGFVRTGLFQSLMTPCGAKKLRDPINWLSIPPELVAERVIMAIRKNRSLVVLTPLAHALWLMKRLSPNLFTVISSGLRRVRRGFARGSAAPIQLAISDSSDQHATQTPIDSPEQKAA
jgi:short-subunit dehydrogenase